MAQTKVNAGQFKFRADLENHIRSKYGLTTDLKPNATIEGTRVELAMLGLSDRSIYWGINCVITDSPTEKREKPKVDRGEQKEFGIGGVMKKVKKVNKKKK